VGIYHVSTCRGKTRLGLRHTPWSPITSSCRGGNHPLSPSPRDLSYHWHPSTTTITMSSNSPTASSRFNYQTLFDSALVAYKKKTGKDLASDPLLRRFESCESSDAILSILREQIPGFDQSQAGCSDTRWARWLNPTVKVLYMYSLAIGANVGQVSHRRFEIPMARC
jgi:hypothetical protein